MTTKDILGLHSERVVLTITALIEILEQQKATLLEHKGSDTVFARLNQSLVMNGVSDLLNKHESHSMALADYLAKKP